MKDTILVTGGKGFLGTHLVRRLTEMGNHVRIFTRPNRHKQVEAHDSNVLIKGDIRDPEAVNKAVRGVDKVIHLVSNFRKGGSDKKEAYAINVEGTENVLKAALENGVKRVEIR